MDPNDRSETSKNRIYFARTYRHLKINRPECLLFLFLFILPSLLLLLFFYDELTWLMAMGANHILQASEGLQAEIASGTFLPQLGPTYYLVLPTRQPDYPLILGNLAVSLCLVWLLSTGPRKGRPIAVYLSIILLIHIMACIFFLLGKDLLPYTIEDFSDLYVKQQIGIWITFLVLIGLVMGLLGRGGLLRRAFTVVFIMLYSFLFGFIRYVLFLWVLYRFSVLYMPLMFFALGPFFDFLYFVSIYSISTNGMIRIYESKMKGEWLWA